MSNTINNQHFKEVELLFNRHFNQLFTKKYDVADARFVEKAVIKIFTAIQTETISHVQELVKRLKNEGTLNACAILGRARLVAQWFENDTSDPSKKQEFGEKKVFLLKTLKEILKASGHDEAVFFKNLYSGRLKYNTAKSSVRTAAKPTCKKIPFRSLFLGTLILVATAAQATFDDRILPVLPESAEPNFKPIPPFYSPELAAEDHINAWNQELDSGVLDRSLSCYTRAIAALQNENQEGEHKHLNEIFQKFVFLADQEIKELKRDWIVETDELITKFNSKEYKVSAMDFVKGVEYLDRSFLIHQEYFDVLEYFNTISRHFQNSKEREQPIHNQIASIDKLRKRAASLPIVSTPLESTSAKKWLSRTINYQPNSTNYINDPKIIALIHCLGFPSDGLLKDGHTELTLAAESGNIGATQVILDIGSNTNLQNKKGYPPLFAALLNKHYRLARILGNAGALTHPTFMVQKEINKDVRSIKILAKLGLDPNQLYETRNSLHWAAAYGHDDSIHALLNLGADPNILAGKGGFTAACVYMLNFAHSPPKRLLQADRYCEATMAAKLLGHVLEIDGEITIGNEHLLITRMDQFPMINNVLKIFKKFAKYNPTEFTTQEIDKVKEFINIANYGTSLENFNKGKPAVFAINFNENNESGSHFIVIFVYENKLVIANKGSLSRKPIEIYEIDPSLLNLQFLNQISNLKGMSEENYLKWLSYISTKFKNKEMDMRYPFDSRQIVENCSWESTETGLYAYIAMLRKNTSAIKSFKRWLKFAEFYSIKNFFKKVSIDILQNNPVLVKAILDKIQSTKWPAKYKNKLQKYVDKYSGIADRAT